jgi:predicted amidophosphoribosyltransferase
MMKMNWVGKTTHIFIGDSMPSAAELRRLRLLETGDYFICASCGRLINYVNGEVCEECDESFCHVCLEDPECTKKI